MAQMPEYIDAPHRPAGRFGRRTLVAVLVGLLVLFVLARIGLSTWVDWLWFASLGFGGVFTRTLLFEVGDFLIAVLEDQQRFEIGARGDAGDVFAAAGDLYGNSAVE